MKTISRKKIRPAIVAMALGFGLAVLALLLQNLGVEFAIIIWCPALLSLMVCAWLMSRANRCPYCGTRLRGLHWSKPDAGVCGTCKETVYYDDSVQ